MGKRDETSTVATGVGLGLEGGEMGAGFESQAQVEGRLSGAASNRWWRSCFAWARAAVLVVGLGGALIWVSRVSTVSAETAKDKAPSATSGAAAAAAGKSGSGTASAGSKEGLTYYNDRIPEKPWSIHVVKVDRSRKEFFLTTTLAKSTVLDLSPLSEQLKGISMEGARAVAAVNGDYYRTEGESYSGDPLGLQILGGELVSGPNDRSCFWVDAQGMPRLGVVVPRFEVRWPNGTATPLGLNEERLKDTARLYTPRLGGSTKTSGGREIVVERHGTNDWLPLRAGREYQVQVKEVREQGNTKLNGDAMVISLDTKVAAVVPSVKVGDILTVSTKTVPSLDGVMTAIGGGPALLSGGKPVVTTASEARHPRSAIGWNDKYWFLVEVDGRQSQLSVGMSIAELREYMLKLGAEYALNLDGGGSATLWLFGQVVNSPCYGYERNTGNGLVIMRRDSVRQEPD